MDPTAMPPRGSLSSGAQPPSLESLDPWDLPSAALPERSEHRSGTLLEASERPSATVLDDPSDHREAAVPRPCPLQSKADRSPTSARLEYSAQLLRRPSSGLRVLPVCPRPQRQLQRHWRRSS